MRVAYLFMLLFATYGFSQCRNLTAMPNCSTDLYFEHETY